MWEQAAEDGRQCIIANRSFVKGYFRAGLAYQNLGNLEAALDVVKRGLGVESGNADLKRMSREIEETMRMKRVEAAIETGNKLLAANEISDAYKTVDAALRLDPTNSTLNNLMDRIRPKYERAEKSRVAGLDRNERIKEEGDVKFKNADFEGAIADYTRCIESLRNDVWTLSLPPPPSSSLPQVNRRAILSL
jgi:tetratricopeptide (TPR) repeat protein